ncbi:MAG: glycoside hydrolase family 16 protein [Gordonia sp. (in: high G+C Gram-positive bacteria)]
MSVIERGARRRGVRRRVAIATLAAGLALSSCSTPGVTVKDVSHDCPTAGTVSGENPWSPGAGWSQVFFDDFDRCSLGDRWSAYSGRPGGNPYSKWDPSMVTVSDGMLHLYGEKRGKTWVTGGVSNYPITQLYGRWEVRMRAHPSADLSYHALLWPKNEQWPPEIDFAESVASKRDSIAAFLHWKNKDGENTKASAWTKDDFTQWHTIGVQWAPGVVKYLLDGKVWAEARGTRAVPTTPMWLALQVEAGACERRTDWGMSPCAASEPRPARTSVDIDWVIVYRPTTDLYKDQNDVARRQPTPGATQIKVE